MNELTKNLYCVKMRSGIELWYEQDRIQKLQSLLENLDGHVFVNLDDRTLNTADISGIFKAEDLIELRTHSGMRQCRYGQWHKINELCSCKENLPQFTPYDKEYASDSMVTSIREELTKKGIITAKDEE